ncbi:MAG: DUF6263 family protein [Planctomycetota bacterium]|jgi:hypothetical protein
MSVKLSVILVAIGLFSVVSLSGCGQSADLSLKFSADDTASYKSTVETVKLFHFDQPNLGKLKEEQTQNLIEMMFTQTIREVNADGSATATITIDGLKVDIINKNESQFSFDSQKEDDKTAPLAKLLGQNYTVTITPGGTVTLLDAKKALASVTSTYEKKFVKGMLLDPKAVAIRHQITAFPKDAAPAYSVDDTWSQVAPSPPGLLAPKSYNKTYTLTGIDGTVATVQMAASESAEPVESAQPAGGMGMFAKMFDNTDDYTGTLKLDMATGTVLTSGETLISTYTAQEMPENGDPEKGPDVLTMQFTHRTQLENLD